MNKPLSIFHHWIFNNFLLVSVVGFSSNSYAADKPAYGAYGLFPQGSTRVLAMGGAFAGLSDDASAINFNPAGLAMAKFKYDIQSGENRIVNKELSVFGTTQNVGVPYNFSFTSIAARFGKLVLGGGHSQPFNMDPRESGGVSSIQTLRVDSYDMFMAYRLSKEFSMGVTLHYESAFIGYEEPGSLVALESMQGIVYPTVGLSYRSSTKRGFGVAYSPERRFDLDDDLNSSLFGQIFFRDVVIPAKLTLGGFYRVGGRLIIVVDVDFISKVQNAVYIHEFSSTPSEKILEEPVTVVHGGYEMEIVKNKNVEFIWRGGGYVEPNRFATTESRPHFTMGVEFRLGPVAVSSAYDQSSDFTNTAHSISFSIDKL